MRPRDFWAIQSETGDNPDRSMGMLLANGLEYRGIVRAPGSYERATITSRTVWITVDNRRDVAVDVSQILAVWLE